MNDIAELVAAQSAELDRVLAGRSFEIVEDGETACSVLTADFTVHVYWLWREKWINSSIQIRAVPQHPLDFHDDIQTWIWLRSIGDEWPQPTSEEMSVRQLLEEYQQVEKVVKEILSDPTKTRESLIFEAGYSQGYNHWVAVPEYAPPQNIMDWVLDRLKKHPIPPEG